MGSIQITFQNNWSIVAKAEWTGLAEGGLWLHVSLASMQHMNYKFDPYNLFLENSTNRCHGWMNRACEGGTKQLWPFSFLCNWSNLMIDFFQSNFFEVLGSPFHLFQSVYAGVLVFSPILGQILNYFLYQTLLTIWKLQQTSLMELFHWKPQRRTICYQLHFYQIQYLIFPSDVDYDN